MLTQERLKQVLDYDPCTGVFTWKKARNLRTPAGSVAGTGVRYKTISIDSRQYLAHRLAWFYVYGYWPDEQVDHKNRNKHDNRIDNLRLATNMHNAWNRPAPANSTTGIKGVYWHKRGYWYAKITVGYRQIHLGQFKTKEQAAAARDEASRKYHSIPTNGFE